MKMSFEKLFYSSRIKKYIGAVINTINDDYYGFIYKSDLGYVLFRKYWFKNKKLVVKFQVICYDKFPKDYQKVDDATFDFHEITKRDEYLKTLE